MAARTRMIDLGGGRHLIYNNITNLALSIFWIPIAKLVTGSIKKTLKELKHSS
jgi:hypothetical protein